MKNQLTKEDFDQLKGFYSLEVETSEKCLILSAKAHA